MPKLVVRTALLSGMRLGEILGLTENQLDFERDTITLTQTKTNKSRRVPMCEELKQVLREAQQQSRPPYIFTSGLSKLYRV